MTLWRVRGIELAIGEPDERVRDRVAFALGLSSADFRAFRVVQKALDARRRGGVRRMRWVYQAEFALDAQHRSASFARAVRSGRVERAPARVEPRVERVHASMSGAGPPVVVVGAGPGGLFAALVLARHGVRAVLIDRGSRVDQRSKELVRFHRTRVPDPESNLLFGEGGAGTYSDGKLYTRVDDPLEVAILEELVTCGAPPEILYDARAHIGTDRLHRMLPELRRRLSEGGVEFAWNVRLEGIDVAGGLAGERVRAVRTTSGEIESRAVLLAPGHSARDTWTALHARGVPFQAKPFQLGVRVEHPQSMIDAAQHGLGPEAEHLGAATYQLVCRAEGASLHSFCMCPGGRIVASVSEPGLLCTNGMSNSKHSSRFATAAIVTTVVPDERGGPFAGVELQRELESRFFAAGGSDYTAPAQTAADFLAGKESAIIPRSSYTFGTRPARVDRLLSEELRDGLRTALARFDRAIPGFASDRGVLVGIETRSSGPVRIPRDAITRRAHGFENLFPVGEGAGYAGGIMSAALDGARSALAMLEHGV